MDEHVKRFFKKLIVFCWLVVLLGIVGAAAGWYVARPASTVYNASATLVGFNRDKTIVDGTAATMDDFNLSQRLVERLQPIATSNKVAIAASRKLMETEGILLDSMIIQSMVSVSGQPTSLLMTLSVTDFERDRAVAICNAVADAFVEESNFLMGSNYINILDPAQTARQTTISDRKESVITGGLIGLVLAVLLIYLFAILDTRIFSLDDMPAEIRTRVTVIPEHNIH